MSDITINISFSNEPAKRRMVKEGQRRRRRRLKGPNSHGRGQRSGASTQQARLPHPALTSSASQGGSRPTASTRTLPDGWSTSTCKESRVTPRPGSLAIASRGRSRPSSTQTPPGCSKGSHIGPREPRDTKSPAAISGRPAPSTHKPTATSGPPAPNSHKPTATCGPSGTSTHKPTATCGPPAPNRHKPTATCGPSAPNSHKPTATCGPPAPNSHKPTATYGPSGTSTHKPTATCGPPAPNRHKPTAICGPPAPNRHKPTATCGPSAPNSHKPTATCGPPASSTDRPTTTSKYLAIDCEMVGTGPKGHISHLGRCSIVSYEGDVVYDKFVVPPEPVTDYRTRWSGIRYSDLIRATAYCQARKEILKLLMGKVVIGHAIHNDFKVLGYSHPAALTRDTSRIPLLNRKAGFPENQCASLKRLTKAIFNRNIQTGKKGHSSVEDARATMELYKVVEQEWERMLASK